MRDDCTQNMVIDTGRVDGGTGGCTVSTDFIKKHPGITASDWGPRPPVQTSAEVWGAAFAALGDDPFPEVSAKCELKDVCSLEQNSEYRYLDSDFDSMDDGLEIDEEAEYRHLHGDDD